MSNKRVSVIVGAVKLIAVIHAQVVNVSRLSIVPGHAEIILIEKRPIQVGIYECGNLHLNYELSRQGSLALAELLNVLDGIDIESNDMLPEIPAEITIPL